MGVRGYLLHLDYILLAATLALLGYGAAMVYFATRHDLTAQPTYYLRQQLLFGAVGLVVMLGISLIDYERYRRWQWVLYGFMVLSIAAVYAVGTVTRGSKRWIPTPFVNLQPSQLAVWILVVALSAFLVDRMELLGSRRMTGSALVYVLLPMALIFFQPDFGTSMVMLALGLAVLFFYGTPWTHFAALFGTAAVLAVAMLKVLPLFGLHLIHSYQMDRLLVFLHPGRDSSGAGYNVVQSVIAVGSGALRGRGNMATQTTLNFLPEHHTDFIFAVIGERYGFVGALILILLYAVFIWRAVRIATLSRDMYGSVMAGGIAAAFLFQIFVNIGMTIGIMPVTGIPLPFISYGGAALITFLMLVGLLEAIHLRATMDSRPQGASWPVA
jgi:rod shape determining protein RodA